jgi:hypothetical protein
VLLSPIYELSLRLVPLAEYINLSLHVTKLDAYCYAIILIVVILSVITLMAQHQKVFPYLQSVYEHQYTAKLSDKCYKYTFAAVTIKTVFMEYSGKTLMTSVAGNVEHFGP